VLEVVGGKRADPSPQTFRQELFEVFFQIAAGAVVLEPGCLNSPCLNAVAIHGDHIWDAEQKKWKKVEGLNEALRQSADLLGLNRRE
jgi:hypothetical protein